jgi:hypothetical protein
VGDEALVASVARRQDWSSNLVPLTEGLTSAHRAELARRWTDVGLLEHASVAAFARFVLEALSLGAPAALLESARSAMEDEISHARDAFALASRYAGLDLGPGPLDVGRALEGRSAVDIAKSTIFEGCIGETIGAIEAAEALAHATCPAVRDALARITLDEARHAELAWQFVKWIVEHAPAETARRVADVLADVAQSVAARAPADVPTRLSSDESLFRGHGILDRSTRNEIRRRTFAEIVRPCARALAESAKQRLDGAAGWPEGIAPGGSDRRQQEDGSTSFIDHAGKRPAAWLPSPAPTPARTTKTRGGAPLVRSAPPSEHRAGFQQRTLPPPPLQVARGSPRAPACRRSPRWSSS